MTARQVSALSITLLLTAAPVTAQRLLAVDTAPGLATVYELSPVNGARTALGTISGAATIPAEFAYDFVAGKLYATDNGTDSLFTIDLTNWSATLVGPFGNTALTMHGLEWDSIHSTLYGMSSHDAGLYQIDTNTGAATLIGLSGLTGGATSVGSLAHDPLRDIMYMTNAATDSLYTIDRSTGVATLIAPMTGTTNAAAVTFDFTTNTLYVLDNLLDTLYTVDVNTGAPTVVGSVGASNMIGLAFVPGAGRLARTAHGCGPTTITPWGTAAPGGTVSMQLGATVGLPLVGLGLRSTNLPYCTCTIGHEWAKALVGSTLQVTIPGNAALVGLQVHFQGIDLLGNGGCASPQFTATDTITVTIG